MILKLEVLSNNYSKLQRARDSNGLLKLVSELKVYVFLKMYNVSKLLPYKKGLWGLLTVLKHFCVSNSVLSTDVSCLTYWPQEFYEMYSISPIFKISTMKVNVDSLFTFPGLIDGNAETFPQEIWFC